MITGVVLAHAVLMTGFICDLVLRQETVLFEHETEHTIALARMLAVSSAKWLAANDMAELEKILQTQQNYPEFKFAMLANLDGIILSHNDRRKLGLKLTDLPTMPTVMVFERSKRLVDVAVPVLSADHQVGWARVGVDMQETYQKVKEIARDGLLYLCIAIFAGALMAWLMARRITGRLSKIQTAINSAKAGNRQLRIGLEGTDEAAILAEEFDAMLDELSRGDAKLKTSAEELHNANLNLEKIVEERTRQLSNSLAQVEKREVELKMAQTVAHIGSWALDISKDELTWSDETYAIFEIELGRSMRVEDFFNHVHPEDRSRLLNAWNTAMNGLTYDIEHRIVVGEKVKWVHEKAQVKFDTNGKALSGIGTVQDITERKWLEQRLQDMIDLKQKIVNASPIGIIAFQEDGPCIMANPSIALIKGMTLENALKLNFHDLDSWKENGLYEKVMTVLDTQKEQQAEIHFKKPVGNTVWLKFIIAPFSFSDKRHFLLMVEDITELKKYELVLKDREELYRSIFNSHSIMLLIDPETAIIVDANQAACDFYGYSYDQLLKLDVTDINAASPKTVHSEMNAVKEGQKNRLLFVHKLADGTLRDVEVYSGKVRVHGKTLLHSIVFDVTERRQAEEGFRVIFDRSPDAYLVMELDGAMISECNSATEAMLGGTKDQIIGKTPDEVSPLYQPDGRLSSQSVLEKLEESLCHGSSRFEWVHQRLDGSDLWVDVSTAVITLKGRQVLFVAWRDIDERKRMIEKLDCTLESLARSNKELEHFAYIASHDLQEPLRMVSSYMQLLSKRYKGKLDSDADEFIYYAVDGALRMKGMIDALLWYARVNTHGRELMPVESERVLTNVLKNLELAILEQNATIHHDPLPLIKADPNQFEQLFQNLIGNAIKFKKPDAPPNVSISAQREDNMWRFIVADNGIGIDLKDKERIFLIFQRLHSRKHYSGTGIGLALCKKIVERHGGEIWVDSKKDHGLSVHFTMPAVN